MKHFLYRSFLVVIFIFLNLITGNDFQSRVSFGGRSNNMGRGDKGYGYSPNSGNSGTGSMNNMVFEDYMFMMPNETDELPDEQRLIMNLLRYYDTGARPVYNASHKVTVKFNFALIQIYDMVKFV